MSESPHAALTTTITMTGVNNSLSRTGSDAFGQVLSAESSHVVLETLSPDYLQKITRHFESSADHSRQDDDPPEAESDSGDSLFITQKPVPEAVRSRRRHHSTLRSDLTSPSGSDEGEDDPSASSSPCKSKYFKGSRKKIQVPKFNFPFLSEIQDDKQQPGRTRRKHKRSHLSIRRNTELHNFAMGGFFKCVRELQHGAQHRDNGESSTAYVDEDGEISPLSEEEERSEVEDIKIVPRKAFVVSCKGRCPQPWYTPATNDFINQEKQQMPGRKQQQSQNKSGTRLFSKMEDSGEGDSPHRGQVKRNLRDIMDTMETLHTGASENLEVEKIPSLSEGDGTEPSAPQNDDEVEFNERNSREDSHDDDKLREEERSLEGSTTDRKERKNKSSAGDVTIAPYVSHRPSECNIDKIGVENGDIVRREDEDSDLASDVRREEDSVFSVSCEVVNDGGERRNKKRRRVREDDEGAEWSPSDAGVGSLNDEDVEIKRKKKKREKKSFVVTEDQEALDLSLHSPQRLTGQLEERSVSQETESVDVKNNQQSTGSCEDLTEQRKKRKKKRKSSFNEAVKEKGDGDVNPCGDDVAVSGQAVKKKKKKKEKEKAISHISEDATAQSDDSVSVQEKEKKRTASFFAADAVEKDATTQQEKAAPWQSPNVYAWSGEKRVSAYDFEAESAEIESADKVKEKKRKKKRKSLAAPGSGFKAGEQDFEKLRESALPEGSELPPNCFEIVGGVKRKKKSRRNEMELVTSVEGLVGLGRGQSDEAAVLKKKKKSKRDPVSEIQDAESETSSLKSSSSVSDKKKRKKSSSSPLKLSHHAEICHDNGNTDEMVNTSVGAERAPSSSTDPASNVIKVKKKKKSTDDVSPEESSNSVRAEPQTRKSKKKKDRGEQLAVLDATSESHSLSHQDTSSSDNLKEDKRAKGERRHHNLSEDFTDV